jgi:rRNA-processing protein FCF1
MIERIFSRSLLFLFALSVCVLIDVNFIAYTQSPQTLRGVIRLKVKFKSGDITKELPRKRFFLIKGTLEENKSLIEKLKQTSVVSRECYYRGQSASEALIKWLNENDCDSIYCRDIEEKYVIGSEAVPEFQAAYNQGLKEFKIPELARRWLTVNVPPALRDGFYNERQRAIDSLMPQAETRSISVMTDRKGTAYLTDIEPGTYTISNLVGSETGKTSIVWACEKEVKAVDLAIAMRRPFTLSNEPDPKVKCEIIERPLPVCQRTVK